MDVVTKDIKGLSAIKINYARSALEPQLYKALTFLRDLYVRRETKDGILLFRGGVTPEEMEQNDDKLRHAWETIDEYIGIKDLMSELAIGDDLPDFGDPSDDVPVR